MPKMDDAAIESSDFLEKKNIFNYIFLNEDLYFFTVIFCHYV